MTKLTFSALAILGFALTMPAAYAARTFCCVDDQGKRVCGDVLPEVCIPRAYTEFDERGLKAAYHDAPLTAEQQAARDAELKKQQEAQKLVVEQQRRDQALLATYATEADLDNAKGRALAEVDRAIKQAQDKLADALKEQKRIAADASAAKVNGDDQADVREETNRNKAEIKGQQDIIAGKGVEREKVAAKFEGDRARLRELRGGDKPDTGTAVGSAATTTAKP